MITNTDTSLHARTRVKTATRKDKHGIGHIHRLQRSYTRPLRDRPHGERDQGRARLSRSCDPPDGPGEEPLGENAPGMVHCEGVHWSEEHTDACDGYDVTNEGGNEPDKEFEPETRCVPMARNDNGKDVSPGEEQSIEHSPDREEGVDKQRARFADQLVYLEQRHPTDGQTLAT